MKILEKWPDEGRIGQHTLTESRRKWGRDPMENNEGRELTITELREKEQEDIQPSRPQKIKGEDSTHLTPTNIDHKEYTTTTGPDLTKDKPNVNQIMRLARTDRYCPTLRLP